MKKQCTTCKKTLLISNFHKSSSGKYGVVAKCKSCISCFTKEYYIKNKEKVNLSHKLHYNKNIEDIKNKRRLYRKSNSKKINAYKASRRASKLNATPKWSETDKILILYKKVQWLEGLTGFKYHVDHVIPLSHPDVCGLHVWGNLQILEKHVNLKKHNKWSACGH